MTLLTDNRTDWNFDENFLKIVTKAAEESLKYENFDPNCEISLSFVTNSEIHKINKQFRNIDRETDVLSFPQLTFEEGEIPEKNENGEIILGDIIISVEKAKAQAEEYGHSAARECGFLTTHSVLHLLGYDHERGEDDTARMRRREKEYLEAIGLTRDDG